MELPLPVAPLAGESVMQPATPMQEHRQPNAARHIGTLPSRLWLRLRSWPPGLANAAILGLCAARGRRAVSRPIPLRRGLGIRLSRMRVPAEHVKGEMTMAFELAEKGNNPSLVTFPLLPSCGASSKATRARLDNCPTKLPVGWKPLRSSWVITYNDHAPSGPVHQPPAHACAWCRPRVQWSRGFRRACLQATGHP
eukprot:scaffold536_cov409-Prasinococcus_capsulatus_cf.AAC.12